MTYKPSESKRIARLEFELTHFEAAVQNMIHYAINYFYQLEENTLSVLFLNHLFESNENAIDI